MHPPINLEERFPHLSKAPIVEAVLDVRVLLSRLWDESSLQNKLKQRLLDYPKHETIEETKFQFSPEKMSSVVRDPVPVGLKCSSDDNPNIVQFNKNSFVFSRLEPYEDWGKFREEALRLWEVYCELLQPSEITRIGLRFINRITVKQQSIDLADYYKSPPQFIEGLNWSLAGYLYQDTRRVPDTHYFVNVVRTTVQGDVEENGLLLDIDVFIQDSFSYDKLRVCKYVEEMHWVKNKVFFGSLTEKFIEECK